MSSPELRGTIYRAIADVLEYPSGDYVAKVRAAADLLARADAKSPAGELAEFAREMEGFTAGQIEEAYTATFDLQSVCYPYVGFHLFGESYARGNFMVWLKGHYGRHGFTCGSELPDHLPVVLRFLAGTADSELENELVAVWLVPAVERMERAFAATLNPYGRILAGLLAFLRKEFAHLLTSAATDGQVGEGGHPSAQAPATLG